MTLFSGKQPRNHGGKKCEVSMDLPCRGGRQRISRGQRPAATSTSLRLRRLRCAVGLQRFCVACQANAAGLVLASREALKELTGKIGGSGVAEDQPGEVA